MPRLLTFGVGLPLLRRWEFHPLGLRPMQREPKTGQRLQEYSIPGLVDWQKSGTMVFIGRTHDAFEKRDHDRTMWSSRIADLRRWVQSLISEELPGSPSQRPIRAVHSSLFMP